MRARSASSFPSSPSSPKLPPVPRAPASAPVPARLTFEELPEDLQDRVALTLLEHPQRYRTTPAATEASLRRHRRDLATVLSLAKTFPSDQARNQIQSKLNEMKLWEEVAQKFDDSAEWNDTKAEEHPWSDYGPFRMARKEESALLRAVAVRIRESMTGRSNNPASHHVSSTPRLYLGDVMLSEWHSPWAAPSGIECRGGDCRYGFNVHYNKVPILEAIKGSRFLKVLKMRVSEGLISGTIGHYLNFLDVMRHTGLTHLDLSGSTLSDADKEVINLAVQENRWRPLQITVGTSGAPPRFYGGARGARARKRRGGGGSAAAAADRLNELRMPRLVEMARRRGLRGSSSMRKAELVRALAG